MRPNMRQKPFTAKTPKTPEFIVDQVWEYYNNTENKKWRIVGVVTRLDTDNDAVIFKDLHIKYGDVVLMSEWPVSLPISSATCDMEYLGTKEQHPEYFL